MSEYIQETSHLWVEIFGIVIIQNSLFLIMILLFLKYFRNTTAQIKYLICVIGVAKLLIPPFIPYKMSSGFLDTYFSDSIFDQKISANIETTLTQSLQNTTIQSNSIGWIELLFLLWILGVLISLGISIGSLFRITLSLRDAQMLKRGVNSKIISNRKINIYISHRITMPLSVVLFPRRIFVPVAWNGWNDRCREIVIKHELTHLERHDNMIQIFQVIVRAIFFFHPLVYILNKKLNLYREMVCDDIAIRVGKSSGVEYSKYLTEIAEKAIWTQEICKSVSAFLKQKSDFAHRIKYQIEEETMLIKSKPISVFIIILLLLSIPVFSWYVSNAEAESNIMKKIQDNVIDIRFYNENEIQIDDKTTTLKDFKKMLAAMAGNVDDLIVDMEFDEQVAMQLVFKVQHTLRELDFLKVRYRDTENNAMNLRLPNITTEEQLKKITPKNILTVQISSTGEIKADNITIDISDLERFLRESHTKNEHLIVNIKAERETIYKDFIIVLDEVKKSQSKRVLIYENIE